MTYTPVSHTLQGIVPTGGAVDFDFSEFLPTTETDFVNVSFTFSQNPIGGGTPVNYNLSDFPSGGLVNSAASVFSPGRPSFGQLYPR